MALGTDTKRNHSGNSARRIQGGIFKMNKQNTKPRPLAFSKLTQRLLAINIVALAIFGGGVLYLDQNRLALTQDRLWIIQSDVQSIADNLSMDYLLDRINSSEQPQEIQTLDMRTLELLLESAVIRTTDRLRLYDQQNKLIVDTTPPAIEVSELPPPGTGSSTKHHENLNEPLSDRFLDIFAPLFSGWLAALNDSFFDKITDTSDLSDEEQCSPEPPLSKDRDGHRVLNASAPVLPWEFKDKILAAKAALIPPFAGCLLLTTSIPDIAQQVHKDRIELAWLSGIALTITLLLSLYLAKSIAHPIRRLAASAESVTEEPTTKHSIPDLSNRHDEIGDLSVAVRKMGDSLSERIDAIERFAGDVAHELKNPLASLSSTNELLQKRGKNEDLKRHLARQADDITRMDRLITEIMNDAKLDSELANALTKKIALEPVLQTLVDVYIETGMTNSNALVLKNDEKEEHIYGDENNIARVFQNLIDNAIAFNRPYGTITILLSSQDNFANILVEDEGPGIPVHNLEKIFDPFVTDSPPTKKVGSHSGLGLSIARKIVRRHGGRIWAENRIDPTGKIIGSRFVVHIPLAP